MILAMQAITSQDQMIHKIITREPNWDTKQSENHGSGL
jgi:hypothetical protein